MQFGKKEEGQFERKLFTGFGLFDVVGCNMTREQLAKLKGYEYKEVDKDGKEIPEISYEGRDAQNKEYVEIVFQLQNKMKRDIFLPAKFRLYDEDATWETEGVTKCQWVNQQGGWCAVDDEKNLLEKFTKVQIKGQSVADRIYRKGIRGEADLYGFLQAWLDAGVAFYGEASADTNILLDVKKIFRNVDKYVRDQFTPLIGSENVGPVNALAIVNMKEKDGKVNHYQGMYNSYWPEWKFKSMVPCINTGNWNASDETRKSLSYLEKGLKKAAYTLGWLKEFSEADHIQAGNDTLRIEDEEDTSSTASSATDTEY